ncbi:hypothetical protein ND748_03170 [Frankia sp. AiPs1]|uniref:hypothetical protein n=1 Tax=Frankia sp. AiPs1 TaxID=573493 RepID=UPI0020435AD6|nr:hypothetical protein [Frankia sp. AiPs1]MCM3920678.1 hypothetical protein [Frankia sp. AiPs1]
MAQVIAVDWSGRAKGAAESIWLARVVAGRLVELDNGLDRAAHGGRPAEPDRPAAVRPRRAAAHRGLCLGA